MDRRMPSAGCAFRSRARVPESARHRDHRHTGRFDGTDRSRVRTQPLDRDHRARTLRREPFRFVLFPGRAGWLSCYQRLSRRGSKRYLICSLILIFLKSGCLGFNKKFISLVLSTLGTARATDFPARTHSSPLCLVSKVGRSAYQCDGSFWSENYWSILSSLSSRNDRYRSGGGAGFVWTNNSSAGSDSCSLA